MAGTNCTYTLNGKKMTYNEFRNEIASNPTLVQKYELGSTSIPNNPNLKNWQELSIKRALKDAVDNNSDYFAWINGEQTSARYNLATHVKEVFWESTDLGKPITINPKDGSPISIRINKEGVIERAGKADWKGKKLDEVLGKGLADKIMEKESGTLSGEGLKFGGEWANNLYDKQVKNIVEDLTGAKVEVLNMGLPIEKATKTADDLAQEMFGTPFNELNSADQKTIRLELEGKTTQQQGIKLTPEVKAIIKGEAKPLKKPKNPLPYEVAYSMIPLIFLLLNKEQSTA